MLLERQAPRRARPPWTAALLIAFFGLCIGALAEPRSWLDALRTRFERGVDMHGRLEPLLRARTVADDTLPDNGLISLSIDIAEDRGRRLQEVRDRALRSGVIVQEADDTVPAHLRWSPEGGALGEPLAAVVRIKGDWLDHVQTSKWSLRIELADGALMGMRRFSVQHPGTRAFLWEWLIQEAAAREGLLRPRSTFVNVLINGRYNGVYFLEEHFSKELLEAQGRREGPIVRFDESNLWSARLENHIHYMHDTPRSVDVSSLPQNAPVEAFGEKRLSRSDPLARQLIEAVGSLAALQGELAPPLAKPSPEESVRVLGASGGQALDELFDVDALARMHALMSLFRAHHGAIWHNMRFYHSPITGRLEPILFDSGAGSGLEVKPVPWTSDDLQRELNSSTRYYAGVFAELARMLDPDYVNDLFAAVEPDLARYEAALLRDGLPPLRTAAAMRATLLEQQGLLLAVQPPELQVHASVRQAAGAPAGARSGLPEQPTGELLVEVRCNARIPLVLEELRLVDGRTLPVRDALRSGAALVTAQGVVLRNNEPPALLAFTLAGADDPPAPGSLVGELSLRPLHMSRTTQLELRLGPAPRLAHEGVSVALQPTLAEALALHPCLGYDAQLDRLYLRRGAFDVEGDLVVPAGRVLHAQPSARLSFEPGAVLITNDALVLEGTARDLVSLAARDPEQGWGGVRVVGARARSRLEFVSVRNARGTPAAGSSAALEFLESSVTLRSVRLEGLDADVALSVSSADILIEGVAFGDLPGDALRAERVTGLLDHCAFDGIAGDALVLSQSNLVLRENRFAAVAGNAVIASEGSSIDAHAGELADVGCAFIARSGAHITLVDVALGSVARRDVAAWTEDAWPPSVIEASSLYRIDERPLSALVQRGSSFVLDGTSCPVSDDVLETLRGEGLLER